MWGNVWFRSLIEVILVAIGGVIFMLMIQTSDQGKQIIQQVRDLMGYPSSE